MRLIEQLSAWKSANQRKEENCAWLLLFNVEYVCIFRRSGQLGAYCFYLSHVCSINFCMWIWIFSRELETARGSCLHAICGTNLRRQRITSQQRTANSPIRIDLQMLWFRHHDELMNFRLYKMDNIKLKRKENPWNYDSKHSSLNERSSTIFSNCNLILGRILFYF